MTINTGMNITDRVMGTQHAIDMVTLAGIDQLEQSREPDNEYDQNAIRVVALKQIHLGYIPAGVSKILASLLDAKQKSEPSVANEK